MQDQLPIQINIKGVFWGDALQVGGAKSYELLEGFLISTQSLSCLKFFVCSADKRNNNCTK
tara:strand:+ start:208 stop:390 length:183 start_codon:yes stop_codon:yes gene_type:complete